MSDDLAQALLCLSFTIPAAALLLLVSVRKNLHGGTDHENSAAIIDEDDVVHDVKSMSKLARRTTAVSIAICLVVISLVTVVTLLVAGKAAATGQCPLGF